MFRSIFNFSVFWGARGPGGPGPKDLLFCLVFNSEAISNELENFKSYTLEKDFWDNREKAQSVLKKISSIERQIEDWGILDDSFEEISLFISMIEDDNNIDSDIEQSFEKFKNILNKMELLNLLNSPDDKRDAILTIHGGAGGTDAEGFNIHSAGSAM